MPRWWEKKKEGTRPNNKGKKSRGTRTDLCGRRGGGVVEDDDGAGRDDDGDGADAGQRAQQLLDERHLRGAADPQHVEVALVQRPHGYASAARRPDSGCSALPLCVPSAAKPAGGTRRRRREVSGGQRQATGEQSWRARQRRGVVFFLSVRVPDLYV